MAQGGRWEMSVRIGALTAVAAWAFVPTLPRAPPDFRLAARLHPSPLTLESSAFRPVSARYGPAGYYRAGLPAVALAAAALAVAQVRAAALAVEAASSPPEGAAEDGERPGSAESAAEERDALKREVRLRGARANRGLVSSAAEGLERRLPLLRVVVSRAEICC